MSGASPDVEPLIRLRGVTKTYRNGELAVAVLHGIDLDIHAGELVAIMGASGSGKSTLMNLLGCLDRPTGGEYRFAGRDVGAMDADELAALRREAFGFIFQSYNLIATANARENVEVPAMYAGCPAAERQERALRLLGELGLSDRAHHRPNQLSGGQQQRVSITRALMNGGHVILADEPTGALDSRSGTEVMRLLRELSEQGHTVILITHAAEVARHAHRVIEIQDGHIVRDPGPATAPRADALAQPSRPARLAGTAADLMESARTALRALRSNLFRAVLTLLGIVIGVGSVITMLAIGDGAKRQVIERVSAMGSNLLLVRPGAPNQRGFRDTSTLVEADVKAIDEELPNVLAAIPEQSSTVTLRREGKDLSTSLNGTSAKFPLARQWGLAEGTFFSAEDEKSYATVMVLGGTVARALFPDGESALGQYVLVNNLMFQVIGVMADRGASPTGQDQDDVVLVPFSTAQLRLSGQRALRNATIAVADVARIDETQAAVEALLAARHGRVDFQIRNMASIIDTASETQDTLTLMLAAIAAISLLVGGIGVMNIMLVSVTERTREIGIRMATGARMRHILQQFLVEAVVVSGLGGLLGVAGGLAAVALVQAFGTAVEYAAAPVLLAFGCAFATGLVFGFLPARKAAALDPVVALASD
ncbi:MacB family efflux pump subunit [Rubrivivax sp. JA1055]|uniref:MacB family efflux pump subunit n=1 Tax=Rubrivivax sp. JA1055 TaxID=2894194 RepID=UPI001E4774FD|nr:MacB family efflux pump subunit [Rubrivivax sp. JA1055]MCC9596133.1 MacB family efflux pump subunit [Rubrivivax sp. JA1055]